jgi:restriction system protein
MQALIGVSIILFTAGIVSLPAWYAERRRRRRLAHVHTLGHLLALTPTQFELTFGELLTRWGYRDVQHTGGGGDLAADLTCRTAAGQLLVVQCKRYAPGNLIGSPEVQKFIGMLTVHHRAQLGIFVTTSSFTQPALTLAHQHNLRTIDGQELTQHIQRAHMRS